MRFLFLLLITLSVARADTLASLKARLQALQGPATLDAEVTFTKLAVGDKAPAPAFPAISARVSESADGLSVHLPATLLAQYADEQRRESNDPSAPHVVSQSINELKPTLLRDLFHSAEKVIQILGQATLTAEENTNFEGQPARLLTFAVTPPLDEKSKKYIKELNVTYKLWTKEDYTPLAASSTLKMRGRAFLVISFQQDEQENFRFATVQDRLVITRNQKEGSGGGGGESNSYKQELLLAFASP